jgi:serine/threonine protein kinase
VDNQLVMIMEFVEGQSLAERLKRGAIPIPDCDQLCRAGLVALSYAHAQHVVPPRHQARQHDAHADGIVK